MNPTEISSLTGREQKKTCHRITSMTKPRVLLLLMLTVSYAAGAGDPPAFEIPWHTVDGGGGTSEGGQFSVAGTIGQHDAGVMSGGEFELSGGFWAASTVIQLPGDCEPDGDVDVDDYACFFACVLGPGQGLLPDCEPFDLDDDGDVTVGDFARLQAAFTGP